MSETVAKLVSVNVGLPREITWQGRTVFTGIWKEPVDGPRTVRRLNVDGDGQGDLKGHGGEHRAVYVYQLDSYRYWQDQMQRDDFAFGQFGENFTVEGLGDDEVCIGDRYRIGSALFEVTPAAGHLLPARHPDGRAAHGRAPRGARPPRLLPARARRGRRAGRRRRREDRDRDRGDDGRRRQRAALPRRPSRRRPAPARAAHPGAEPGLAGIAAGAPRRGARGFPGRRQRRADRARSAAGVARLPHAAGRGEAIGEPRRRVAASWSPTTVSRSPAPRPGQFITLKLTPAPGRAAARAQLLARRGHRATPATGSASRSNRTARPATTSAPASRSATGSRSGRHADRSSLDDGERAGRARQRGSRRDADARDAARAPRPPIDPRHLVVARRAEPGRARVRRRGAVAPGRPRARAPSRLVQPAGPDRPRGHGLRRGRAHHAGGARSGGRPARRRVLPVRTDRVHGRAARRVSSRSGFPPDACTRRSSARRMRSRPGSSPRPTRPPHQPDGAPGIGTAHLVRADRARTCAGANGVASILELAEACDVPVRWSCRTGVCHTCETGLLDGTVDYSPEPLEAPADGNVLLCCSRPDTDLVDRPLTGATRR